jgi:immune inhibitor A
MGSHGWRLLQRQQRETSSSRPVAQTAACWISASTITASSSLTIKPYTATTGHVYKLISPKFDRKQYLLLECRKKVGFDFDLPGEGLLVWKVDEVQEQLAPTAPGMSLIQADGRNDLNSPDDWNQGDAADPFPGSESIDSLADTGPASTSFPGKRSGISLKNITFDSNGVITLDVRFKTSTSAKKVASVKPKTGAKKGSARTRRTSVEQISATKRIAAANRRGNGKTVKRG